MVLVFVDNQDGKFKKADFEAVSYGTAIANSLGTECNALVLGSTQNPGTLGEYGATCVFHVDDQRLDAFDSQVFANVITQVAKQNNASVVVLKHSAKGKALIGRLAVRLEAGSASGVNTLPVTENGFEVEKAVFSGKAFARYRIDTPIRVLSLMGNSFQLEKTGQSAEVKTLNPEIPESKVKVREVNRVEGIVPLPEADLVVSAGRGMKDGSNWGIIEELAASLNATTACSRPVADAGWRPHHEHVGQTGIAIRPNLYLAIGISGAIQHLAGVNNSKVIVVINKDPEAPFFKAADYGVCADLFEVVPMLTEAVKKYKQPQS